MTFSEAVDANLVRAEACRLAILDAGVLLPPYAITDCRVCLAFTHDDVDQTIDAAHWRSDDSTTVTRHSGAPSM